MSVAPSSRAKTVLGALLTALALVCAGLLAVLTQPGPTEPEIHLRAYPPPHPLPRGQAVRSEKFGQNLSAPDDNPHHDWQHAQARAIAEYLHRCGVRPEPVACSGPLCVSLNPTPTGPADAWDRVLSYAPRKAASSLAAATLGLPELDPCHPRPAAPDVYTRLVDRPRPPARDCFAILPGPDPGFGPEGHARLTGPDRPTAEALCATLR